MLMSPAPEVAGNLQGQNPENLRSRTRIPNQNPENFRNRAIQSSISKTRPTLCKLNWINI